MSEVERTTSARAWARRWLLGLGATYLLLCVAAFIFQGALLFHPTSETDADADALVRETGGVPLEIQVDGATLRGLLVPGQGRTPRPTILYFGGNGEGVASRARDRDWLLERGWNLVLVAYRGYDRSSGDPSADALLSDAPLVFDAVARRPEVDPARIVTWGFSLGTGLAARVAAERSVAGVILAAPYARLSEVAADRYPWLPVRWLFRHEIDTLDNAPEIDAAGLVVHGEDDTLIPPEHGRRVSEAWGGPVRRVTVPGAGHNAVASHATLREEVLAFLMER